MLMMLMLLYLSCLLHGSAGCHQNTDHITSIKTLDPHHQHQTRAFPRVRFSLFLIRSSMLIPFLPFRKPFERERRRRRRRRSTHPIHSMAMCIDSLAPVRALPTKTISLSVHHTVPREFAAMPVFSTWNSANLHISNAYIEAQLVLGHRREADCNPSIS